MDERELRPAYGHGPRRARPLPRKAWAADRLFMDTSPTTMSHEPKPSEHAMRAALFKLAADWEGRAKIARQREFICREESDQRGADRFFERSCGLDARAAELRKVIASTPPPKPKSPSCGRPSRRTSPRSKRCLSKSARLRSCGRSATGWPSGAWTCAANGSGRRTSHEQATKPSTMHFART